MTAEIIRVHEHDTRANIEAAIAALRIKQQRMPAHWVDRRAEVADEIDELVEQWLETPA